MKISKYDGRTHLDASMRLRDFNNFMSALDELGKYTYKRAEQMASWPENHTREFELLQLYIDRKNVFHDRLDVEIPVCEMIADAIDGNADTCVDKATFEQVIEQAERSGFCKPC